MGVPSASFCLVRAGRPIAAPSNAISLIMQGMVRAKFRSRILPPESAKGHERRVIAPGWPLEWRKSHARHRVAWQVGGAPRGIAWAGAVWAESLHCQPKLRACRRNCVRQARLASMSSVQSAQMRGIPAPCGNGCGPDLRYGLRFKSYFLMERRGRSTKVANFCLCSFDEAVSKFEEVK